MRIFLVTAAVCVVACGGGGPKPGPLPGPSVAGTWRGGEAFSPSQSGPAEHCLISYLRDLPGSLSTSVTLTVTQDGTTVRGTYSGEDRGAFAPFSCEVSGTLTNGDLSLDLTSCAPYSFALTQNCQGLLQRTGGRLTGKVSGTVDGGWRISMSSRRGDGTSLGDFEWVATVSLRR